MRGAIAPRFRFPRHNFPVNSPLIPITLRVRTYELDSFGHVNNAVYLNYLEEARAEFLRQIGLSFNDFAAAGVQLVIVEARVRYVSPARYGDLIAVQGRFADVRAVSLVIDYTITEGATGRLIATAQTKGAFVAADSGRPTRAPAQFRDAFLAAQGDGPET
jgi:YbgC/YbaW family acyl-CoA thioester hydrolase